MIEEPERHAGREERRPHGGDRGDKIRCEHSFWTKATWIGEDLADACIRSQPLILDLTLTAGCLPRINVEPPTVPPISKYKMAKHITNNYIL